MFAGHYWGEMKKYIPVEKDGFTIITEKELFKDEALALKNYYHEKERYQHIEKELLIAGSDIYFDLYIHINLSYKPLLYASKDSPLVLTHDLIDSAKECDIVIKAADIPMYHEYIKSLENQTALYASEEKIKAYLIKEKSKLIVRDVLSDPNNGRHIKESGKIVEQIASSIFSNRKILYNMISLKNHDYYTYVHSTNTAVLSIGLGIAAGLSKNDLYNLGFSALLHDIGKTKVPAEILNKPGRLTFFEYRMMQNHVLEGGKILKNQPYFPAEGISGVVQHHEKLNGHGYPFSLSGDSISNYGKILAITDCYDALTTDRPYKAAHTPFGALSIIVNDCEQYDADLLRTFIKMLGGVEG